jgi:hypothetical protein
MYPQLFSLAASPLAIFSSMTAMSRGVVRLSRLGTAARSLLNFW